MCRTATVLKLSKRKKKYEKYELILAKYVTLIFLTTFPAFSCWLRAARCHQLESDQMLHGNDTSLIFSEAVSVWTSEGFHISTPCCSSSSGGDGTVCNSSFLLLSSTLEKWEGEKKRKENLLFRRGSNFPHTHAVAGDRFIQKNDLLSDRRVLKQTELATA